MSNLEGAILSDYLLLQCIGKGGIADVYRARQNGEGNYEVAAKVFRSSFAQRATFRDYFMAEAEKIGQLEHPNILPLVEFGEGEDLLYVVMPYVATGTLEDLLRRVGGKFSALQSLPVMQQLCSAIYYAHTRGVIHGNLKLSNIFVAPDGRMLLSDFGIVRDYDDSQQSLTRVGWGSAEYAAPEQSLGVIKQASDIYALGVLLFRLLAGQPPFSGQTPVEVLLKHVRQAPPSIRTIVPDVSDAVDGVLQMAMQKRAEDRFASVEEFNKAFYAAVSVAPVASPVARPITIMNPQTPQIALPSPSRVPDTPVPAGRVEPAHSGAFAGPQTPLPSVVPVAQPRITKELSPAFRIEGNGAGVSSVANVPKQTFLQSETGQSENRTQQVHFEPGVAIGGKHFWSAEPVEWSPIGIVADKDGSRNDVPMHVSTYLQEKANVQGMGSNAASPSLHLSPTVSGTAPAEPVPVSARMSVGSAQQRGEETESAFAQRLRKLLPIIVVVLLLLGLLGALLSSAFFPSSNPGANTLPLHSVSGAIVSVLGEVVK